MIDSGKMLDEVFAWSKLQKERKLKGKKADKEIIAEIRGNITRIRGLMALRSGLEKARQEEMIDTFARVESQEACNGIQN